MHSVLFNDLECNRSRLHLIQTVQRAVMNAEGTESTDSCDHRFPRSGSSVSSHHPRHPNAVASSDYRIRLPTFSILHRLPGARVQVHGMPIDRTRGQPRGEQPHGPHISAAIEFGLHRPKVVCGIKAEPFTLFSNVVIFERSVLFSPTSGPSNNALFENRLCSLFCNCCPCSPSRSRCQRAKYVIFISMPFKKLYQLLINADSAGGSTIERRSVIGLPHVLNESTDQHS
jgi:hypothetical protein